MTPRDGSVRVSIVNDYELVVMGLRRMLHNCPPLEIVETNSLTDPQQPVDIVLYDTFAPARPEEVDRERLLRHPHVGRLVIYTWNMAPERVAEAISAGVHGYLSKSLSRDELVDALVRVSNGEVVVSETSEADVDDDTRDAVSLSRDWPGRTVGLSSREAEVIGLITQGHTNDEIARQLYLSLNSVKSYIRSAYRKMGVERRSQAVLWGIQHGFLPRAAVHTASA